MELIYMDGSGDLGFPKKQGSSKFCIVTCLFIESIKDVEIIVKNVRKWAGGKGIKINGTFFRSNILGLDKG